MSAVNLPRTTHAFARLHLSRSTRRGTRIVPLLAFGGLVAVSAPLVAQTAPPLINLVTNPSVETDSNGDGVPDGFAVTGWGTNTYTVKRVTPGYSGQYAVELKMPTRTDGDRKLLATFGGVVPGHRYSLGLVYWSTAWAERVAVTKSGSGDWTYWFSAPTVPMSDVWLGAPFTTPPVPAGVTSVGFGLAINSVGQITSDSYSAFDLDASGSATTTTTRPTTTTSKPGTTTTTTRPTTTTTVPIPPSPVVPWATNGEVNLYVSPSGSDSNTGTRDRPLRQVQKAADMATPGTVVHIADGDYNSVINNRGGSEGRLVTFLADNLGGARINQTGIDPAWLNYSDWVDIVGFDLQAPKAHQGLNNQGNYVRVYNSHIHNVFTEGSCTGGAGINHEYYPGKGNAAIGNVIHQIGVVGCQLTHGVYVSNSDSFVQNNLVYDVAGYMLHFYHAADNGRVANNTVFAGNTSRGAQSMGGIILCADEGNTVPADDFVVNNGIIRDVAVGVAECGQMGVNLGPNNQFKNNLMYDVAVETSTYTPVEGTITADPKFVNWQANGTGDYRLTTASPALHTGVNNGAPTFDKELVPRPLGPAVDRGAYEGGP
jgi:hypothetical protein